MRRFDLVGIDPRGVGHSTPELRCRTDAEFDAFRREPMADYSPDRRRPHRSALRASSPTACAQQDGHGVPRQRRDRVVGARHGRRARRAGREPDQLSRLLLRHRARRGLRRAIPRPRAGDGARRRRRPQRWTRSPSSIRQMAGFQTAFNDYAADCAQSAGCPLGTDPAKFVDRFHELVDPLVNKPGRTSDPRGLSYQDAITGTVNALYTQRYWQYLTSGLLGLQRGTDAGDLLLLADDYQHRDAVGPLQEPAGCVHRDSLRRRAVPDRPGGVGRRRSADPRGRAVHGVRHLHRVRPARHVRDVAGAADVDSASSHLTRPRQGRRGLHHARPGHAVCRRAWIWPVRWAPR